MVTVAIIGILAAIGIQNFRVFQARAKATEATIRLDEILALEETYFATNDSYEGLYMIGFRIGGVSPSCLGSFCSLPAVTGFSRYSYVTPMAGGPFLTFIAIATAATAILGSCQTAPHIRDVNQSRQRDQSPGASKNPPGC